MLVTVSGAVALWVYVWGRQSQLHSSSTEQRAKIIPVTSFTGYERQPAFAPDGNQIAFVWDGERGDNPDIYVKLIDAGEPLRLTTDPAPDHPSGQQMGVNRFPLQGEESGVYSFPSGGTERKLADTFGAPSRKEAWLSRGGDWRALADNDSVSSPSIYLFIPTGENGSYPSPGARGDAVGFSPTGTVAFGHTSRRAKTSTSGRVRR